MTRQVDFTSNFFLAKVDKLREVRWDEQLKITGEHFDFFLRASRSLKIGFLTEVEISHFPENNPSYNKYRRRGSEFVKLFREKHGIVRQVKGNGWNESTEEPHFLTSKFLGSHHLG